MRLARARRFTRPVVAHRDDQLAIPASAVDPDRTALRPYRNRVMNGILCESLQREWRDLEIARIRIDVQVHPEAEGAIVRLGDMLRYALKEDGRDVVEFH